MKKISMLLSCFVLSAGCAATTVATTAPVVRPTESSVQAAESVLLKAVLIRDTLTRDSSSPARSVIRLDAPSLPNDIGVLVKAGDACVAKGNALEIANLTKFVLTVAVDGKATRFLTDGGIIGYLPVGQTACVQLERGTAKRAVKVIAHLVDNAEAIELISIKHEQATVPETKTFRLVVDYARLLAR